jgi:hypothetical protein
MATKDKNQSTVISYFEAQIDQLNYEIFGLIEEEIKIVEGV